MGESGSFRLAMIGARALVLAMMLGGCAANDQALFGTGQHRVTEVYIRAFSMQGAELDGVPVCLRVGARLQLRAMAAWEIPAVTEETEKAAWTVSDPAVGAVDRYGVFTARKSGRALVTAVIRVSQNGAGKVLGSGQAAKSGPVRTFQAALELNVFPPHGAEPQSGAP